MNEGLIQFFSNSISVWSVVWLVITVVFYFTAVKLYSKTSHIKWLNPLLHPIIVCAGLIIIVLSITSSNIVDYQRHTDLLSSLLGPATVALAIPLYHQFRILIKMSWRVVLPICIAAIMSPLLSWLCLYLLDSPLDLQLTILVKSITTPLAMDTAQAIGGIPALAAVFVISTGIVGAVCGPPIFALLKVHSHAAQGTAMGSVAHVIGTARTIGISEQCTAFATLALCLNGIITSLLLPLLFST